jgi:hypothetical protein
VCATILGSVRGPRMASSTQSGLRPIHAVLDLIFPRALIGDATHRAVWALMDPWGLMGPWAHWKGAHGPTSSWGEVPMGLFWAAWASLGAHLCASLLATLWVPLWAPLWASVLGPSIDPIMGPLWAPWWVTRWAHRGPHYGPHYGLHDGPHNGLHDGQA